MIEDLIVYTVLEVAAHLKCERKKVERLIKSGALSAKLVGNSYRITHRVLLAFIHDLEPGVTVPMVGANRQPTITRLN